MTRHLTRKESRLKKLTYGLISMAALGVVATSTVGVVSAATPTIGSSGIPITTFRQDKISSVASVLKISPASVKSDRKDKTLRTVIKNSGLTLKEFRKEVKAQFISTLESQGYTKSQIISAIRFLLMHRYIK